MMMKRRIFVFGALLTACILVAGFVDLPTLPLDLPYEH